MYNNSMVKKPFIYILLFLFLLSLGTVISATNISVNYGWNGSQMIPVLLTHEGKLKTDLTFSAIIGSILGAVNLNMGNWSADKTGLPNLSLSNINSNMGNWSSEKGNYVTHTLLNGNMSQISSIVYANFSSMSNLSLQDVNNSIGNWSLDKSGYQSKTENYNISIYNVTSSYNNKVISVNATGCTTIYGITTSITLC